ncbi:MAG: FtsQ-type POTRA domain-containing protein [Acidobacteria bacterium]|nr:FtsQ-type POTRA domain-containing protein [Acidobacteriota bacterium]
MNLLSGFLPTIHLLMTRKASAVIQEELYPPTGEAAPEEIDDARLLDLEVEKESPFLRAQKRVPARRAALPRRLRARVFLALAAIVCSALMAAAWAALYHYGEHSWRFRLQSSDDIEMSGLHNVTRVQVMEVMGGDIGRNIFFIPLDERQKQLEQIPWVQSASVMRFAPNRIRIEVEERTPVAFARVGSKIMLVDSGGALMELTAKKRYSFPVIVGMSLSEPLTTREARMRIFNELVRELDSGGGRYSQDLSEVDLSDPEDVKVLTNDPEGEVLVHLGASNYLDRFKIYVAHLRAWRQQFQKLESVDLRYERQIIVNPDLRGTGHLPALSAAAARRAISAGVSPAAIVERQPGAVPQKQATGRHGEKASPARRPRRLAPRFRKPPLADERAPIAPPRAAASPASPAKPSPAVLKGAVSR